MILFLFVCSCLSKNLSKQIKGKIGGMGFLGEDISSEDLSSIILVKDRSKFEEYINSRSKDLVKSQKGESVLSLVISNYSSMPDFLDIVIRKLAEDGVELDLKDGYLLSTDSYEVYERVLSLVPKKYFIMGCKDSEKLTSFKYNSVQLAVLRGDKSIISFLLKDSFSKNRKQIDECSKDHRALFLALHLGKLDIAKQLISYGASLASVITALENEKINKELQEVNEYIANQMLFDLLNQKRFQDILELFGLYHQDLGVLESGDILSDNLAKSSYSEYLKELNLPFIDKDGKNIFHHLASFNRVEIKELLSKIMQLMKEGFEEPLFSKDNFNLMPFHYALKEDNKYFVEYILSNEKYRERINDMDLDEYIKDLPLRETSGVLKKYIWDVRDRKLEVAKINETNSRGENFLIIAVKQGNLNNIRILLSQGANPSIELGGKTAIDYAHEHGNIEAEKLLRTYISSNK